jgi:hypothetical protein
MATDGSDAEEIYDEIRQFTPEERYAEKTLSAGLPVATKLESYSNWLTAGAGAALLVLMQKESFPISGTHSWLADPAFFLFLSLFFGAIAKAFAYICSVQDYVGPVVKKNIARLLQDVGKDKLSESLKKATELVTSRTRIPGSLFAKWGARRGAKDRLAMAVISGAAIQYLGCSIACQILCILNAAERIAFKV